MRIAAIHSHVNGHEYILSHRPHMWQELVNCIESIDSRASAIAGRREDAPTGWEPCGPVELRRRFSAELRLRGWTAARARHWTTADYALMCKIANLSAQEQKRRIEASGHVPISLSERTDFVKERIAVEVQLGKYSFIAYDLFVKHMAFFVGDVIDVGVEILAMKELQSEMSSGIGYYAGALYDLIRQGRGVPAVPLVLVGIAP